MWESLVSGWHVIIRIAFGKNANTIDELISVVQVEESPKMVAATSLLRQGGIPEKAVVQADEENVWEGEWMQELTSWNPADIDQFAEGRHVSKKTLETWISAGLLHPDETAAAEKVIRAIRRKDPEGFRSGVL